MWLKRLTVAQYKYYELDLSSMAFYTHVWRVAWGWCSGRERHGGDRTPPPRPGSARWGGRRWWCSQPPGSSWTGWPSGQGIAQCPADGLSSTLPHLVGVKGHYMDQLILLNRWATSVLAKEQATFISKHFHYMNTVTGFIYSTKMSHYVATKEKHLSSVER